MAGSLMQGKRFFCREWAFSKIQHCLETRLSSKTCGALIMGGAGSGKTVVCCELVWPTSSHGRQRLLRKRLLAYHFCQAHDVDTLSVAGFVQRMVDQLVASDLIPGYAVKLEEPEVREALEPARCEQNPDDAFKKAVLFPLLELDPPKHTCFMLVDSIDESIYLQPFDDRINGTLGSSNSCSMDSVRGLMSKTIAELLAAHYQLFPQWMLLFCTSRKSSKTVNKLFTGFRKISLDDLHKANVVRDVQQYILSRLDQEEALRQHLSRETAEMLNQLHIKSNGCFLYLETVLNGVIDSFIVLREICEIPGTLNGLFLWLCQRLFNRKQFTKVQGILNILLASRRPLTVDEIYRCLKIKYPTLGIDTFRKRLSMLNKLILHGAGDTRILFHHSFAEWLLDVKHCTQKYLCNAVEGHALLAMSYTLRAQQLQPHQVLDLAWHLNRMNLPPPFDSSLLPLWLVYSGVSTSKVPLTFSPRDNKVIWLLRESGCWKNRKPSVDLVDVAGGEADASENLNGNGIQDEILGVEDIVETVNVLMQEDADDQNVLFDINVQAVLHDAAQANDVRLVRVLIGKGIDVDRVDNVGQTALNVASRQGHIEVVRLLLDASTNLDHADSDGWTSLRSAAWAGHTEVVSTLLKHGVQVDLADADVRTPLRSAAWGGHEEIVRKLLESGACVNKVDNEGRTALIAAAYMGHGEIVQMLLRHGASVDHEDQDGRTALSVAALCIPASKGHVEVVNILLENGAEVNHQDHDGMSPLLVAASEGHKEVCEMLLEYDADVDHMDKNGRTPLFAAASGGHADVINLLLFFGAAVDAIDGEGRTVLSIAAAQGNVEIVRQLLDRGLDEMHRDNSGWTPLHYAAYEGQKDVCEALMEVGARVDEVDNDGRHALILAAQEGHLETVTALVDGNATIDLRSHSGKTAFRAAAIEERSDVAEFMVSRGADVNYVDADGRSTLYMLALENKVSMTKFALECGASVVTADPEGRTPLHVASWQGNAEIVRFLISKNAAIDAIDHDCRTALQLAAWQGNCEVVKILVENVAKVDHTCNQGATALCIASQEGHEDVVRVLLEWGADPKHADQFGRSPARVASKCGHMNVVELLEEYGGGSSSGSAAKSPVKSGAGIGLSHSNNSVASCSTAETKPSSAILCPPGLNSPAVSPESTCDKRCSFVSNLSLSKSSSNLTTSTKSSRNSQLCVSTGQDQSLINCDSESGMKSMLNALPALCAKEFKDMSFTQQLQQCTRNRNRPSSCRLLSPLDEPHSGGNTPIHSPVVAIVEQQYKLLNSRSSCLVNISLPPQSPFSSRNTPITSNIGLLATPSRAFTNGSRSIFSGANNDSAKTPSHTASPELSPVYSVPLNSAVNSQEAKVKRNGIVTNPNFKLGAPTPVSASRTPYLSSSKKTPTHGLSGCITKVTHNSGRVQKQGPSGNQIKKETPL
ncbi:Ankyrin repeat domain-containing protein 50 [Chamberlinius hualienensis]